MMSPGLTIHQRVNIIYIFLRRNTREIQIYQYFLVEKKVPYLEV